MVGVQIRQRRQRRQRRLRRQRKAARLSRPEVRHMGMLLREGKNLSDPNFHQKLTDEFNQVQGRVEGKAIKVQQVQRWFLNRLKLQKIEVATSRSSSKDVSPVGEESLTVNAPQCSDLPDEKGDKVSEEVEMEFDGKSSRDMACNNQAKRCSSTFLAHRVLSSGEVGMVGGQRRQRKAARLSRPEVRHMGMLLREGKNLSDPNFHQKLTDEFNQAPRRVEGKAIKMQQVQRWFLSRLKIPKIEDATSRSSSKDESPVGEESLTINAPQCSDLPEENGEKVSEEVEMEFEAKSSRDMAWYDVATFLAHRVLSSGEVEVRVRYDGFGPEEDEWVDVRKSVRERSMPMESSECWKIKEGDIVLCFREKDEAANYFDAHVLQVERKMHDIRGCRCIYLVQYDHDQTEEKVHLSRLCCRP